ncbi:hypothetical protein GCM10014715_59050 [Streptomyces spiralis]|uniref:MmyB-like transcription regulator ligand binding domain-containing protein n=1 Tax=Streptomyces spiralis TaxID=66376 RepID=A0A919AB94_9ACTN|nr:hypothetical protein [Streptomyces spiralis]GHE95032.1 hypothetical protein GCM10014715_59050 [Streptomyces spiralis]
MRQAAVRLCGCQGVRPAGADQVNECSGVKHLHHPLVGDLAQPYEAMGLPSGPGLRLNFCTPEPDSREREALGLLAGWASTGAVVPSRRDRSGNDRSGNDRSGNG